MYKLVYSELADIDLTSIFNYIAEDNRERAVKYLGEMEKSILLLRDSPDMGASGRFPELQALGIRVLVHDKYLIFYTVDKQKEAVNIIRVLNGAMNYRKLFVLTPHD